MDLETTVRALAPSLLRYGLAVTRERSLAEEVTQDALLALVARWRRHGPPECAAAFVFAIARRRAARARRRARGSAPLTELAAVAIAGEQSPEASAVDTDQLRRALAEIERLPRREAEALRLVAFAGLSAREAAAALDIGESALKMRVSRARERLRKELSNGHRP